jgi:hypothetical protein
MPDITIKISGQLCLEVATSKHKIAGLKEAQGDLEGARRLFLECEQIYVMFCGADHENSSSSSSPSVHLIHRFCFQIKPSPPPKKSDGQTSLNKQTHL